MSQTPRQFKRGRDTKIPQSSGPPKKVDDEAVHKELGDRMERAATTASSLEAEQDSGSGPRVHTLGSGEDSMQLMELMAHCTKLSALIHALHNRSFLHIAEYRKKRCMYFVKSGSDMQEPSSRDEGTMKILDLYLKRVMGSQSCFCDKDSEMNGVMKRPRFDFTKSLFKKIDKIKASLVLFQMQSLMKKRNRVKRRFYEDNARIEN
ncbi:hypothetical protein Tco_1097110 [Tanacetum coccineum]